MTRTQKIVFNLIAVTVLLITSGIALCFQVAHGETVDPFMALTWWSVWILSCVVGVEVVFDAVDNQQQAFEEWLEAQMPPLFEEDYAKE